jgi:2-methylcitrate dehydratase PrpD
MIAVGRRLASYAASSRYEDLPPDVRHEGRRAFVNWLGCVLGGFDDDAVRCALAAADEISGPRHASAIGYATRLDVQHASFVNAIAASVHAFDDTHYATVAHPSAPVAAASYALGEHVPMRGTNFLHALVLGIEIQCRIGNMLTAPPAQCNVGLSMAGLVGGIGAAIAAGKLLSLGEQQLLNAIGIAANQAGGLREAHASMSSHFTPGRAAFGGVLAARLAAKSFECSPTMLEGPKGFAACFATDPNFEIAVDGLGSTFETLKLAYKPYPTGFVIHPAIDVCLDLAQRGPFREAMIERVELTLNPLAVQLTDCTHPKDRRQALVSVQHWAAVSLKEGKAGIEQGSASRIDDPAIGALRQKVRLATSASVGTEAARATLHLQDGTIAHASTDHCRGSVGRPMTDDELSAKFLSQAASRLPPRTAEGLLAQCWRVDEMLEVRELARHLP